jgi:hypothetical protein
VKQEIDDMKKDGKMKVALIPFMSVRVVEPKVRRGKFPLLRGKCKITGRWIDIVEKGIYYYNVLYNKEY